MTPNQINVLQIGDLAFEIKQASIEIEKDENDCRWNVDVITVERMANSGSEEGQWCPRLYGEYVLMPSAELAVGAVIEVPEGYDEEREEYNFAMYVFEHEEAFGNRLQVLELIDDRALISWQGLCHINWEAPYDRDVPFKLEAWFSVSKNAEA
jgi:hypothetical protein